MIKKILVGIAYWVLILQWFAGTKIVMAQTENSEATNEIKVTEEVNGGNPSLTEQSFEARVVQILDEKTITLANSDKEQIVQNLQLEITSGTRKGEIITLENGAVPIVGRQKYAIDDKLVISGEPDNYYISDVVRRPILAILAILFVVAAILVGRGQGLTSILGLVISFLVIFWFVLPKIAAGDNPILIVVLACLLIVPVMFILSHGLNKKTWVAMVATIITMILTGLLIAFFVQASFLTGLASEEAGFLQAMNPGLINLRNLLIAGMLFATLGVLDDITISQAAVVEELKKAKPDIKFGQLYKQAMRVGRDHIASMINTLILVYAGASFPLLLMFTQSQQNLALTMNFELIAEEIVRTLTSSIGLILAVPLTTLLASWAVAWRGGE